MFFNKKCSLILIFFLVTSPIDVIGTILTADALKNDTVLTYRNEPLNLDLNPLHILCLPCEGLSKLLGGLLGALLGKGLLTQLGIFSCSLLSGVLIHIPFVPNLVCLAIFEVIAILGRKTGANICPLLLLCPLPKKPVPVKKPPILGMTAEQIHEQNILDIIESQHSQPLSKEMEVFYNELVGKVPADLIGVTAYDPAVINHALRNFVAAVEYQLKYAKSSAPTIEQILQL